MSTPATHWGRDLESRLCSEVQELHSLALSLLEAEATRNKPKDFCQTHTREYTGEICPLCAKEAAGQLKVQEPVPVGNRQVGAAFRDRIRARPQAKNPAA